MAIFTVTTAIDEPFGGIETIGAPDGAGLSLREVIALAKVSAGDDVIVFAGSLAGATFELTNDPLLLDDPSGDELVMLGEVTIDAGGQSMLTGVMWSCLGSP